ncbi:hypothetical protein AB0D54_05470 [Streptomyces xanthophaeus]|uniref:hypothetical protein n=1 Tax=Streptomyces xanthophaeus TaxID=67385 RepID=UPI003441C943
MSVGELCAGLLLGEGANAVERVLESSRFVVKNEKDNPDIRTTAQALEDAYRAGENIREVRQPSCRVSQEPSGTIGQGLRLSFAPLSRHIRKWEDFLGPNDKGVRVEAQDKHLWLGFDCVSSRAGSTQEIPLRISVHFLEHWANSKGSAVLAQDYRTITHGAALAVAKELGCVNDGGLPAQAAGLPEPDAG